MCGALCEEKVGMRLLEGKKQARSHQEVFGEMDDMCEGCRRRG